MSVLVSVCSMVYNHEKYVRQALDGIINQKTNFKFEIIVHDDASTDNTAEIVKEYEFKYPDLFNCIYQVDNQFLKQNVLTDLMFPLSRGKYIALCEGDDFWTDENKLQKQVDALESNGSVSCCFHKVFTMNEIENFTFEYPIPNKTILNFRDILSKHYIATSSILFNKSFLPMPFPKWLSKSRILDIPIELMLADKGNFVFINQEMGCYRKNINSITSDKNHIKNGRKIFLYVYINLNKEFRYKYWNLFFWKIFKLYLGKVKDYINKFR